MQDSDVVLSVRDLGVELDGSVILAGLSFELKERDTLVILGPNGAGKTVLLRALLGLLPHRGQVAWKAGARIGYVPQRIPINRELPVTVGDFFDLKKVKPADVPALLRQVGVIDPNFPAKQLGLLSSGQFQRVLIAWALAADPTVLLFDEPTAGVDVGGEETIYNLLHRTQQERRLSVILVTHDLSTVYSRATHVLCLNNKASCYGRPEEILDPEVLHRIYGQEIRFYRHAHE